MPKNIARADRLAARRARGLDADLYENVTITIKDRGRGRITLTFRDSVVVGAMGSEPARFLGLTAAQAERLAAGGK